MADDFKSSSDEETDRSNDEAGTGRSYECVFCKRGFTTAQALGGHMNIHRKDRAKPRPNSNSISADYYYANLGGFPAIQTYAPPAIQVHYQNFLPAAAGWGFRPPIGEGFYAESPQVLDHVEEDWTRNLSLQIGPSDHVNGKREDDELDLELRLGHHDH